MLNSIARRPLLAALGAGLTLASLFTALPVFAQDMLELTLATGDSDLNPTTDSVLKLALSGGFYEKHGLKVTIVALDGTPQAIAALNSGAADIADIGIDAALRLRAENDVPVRGIVAATLGVPFLIVTKDDITDVAGLAGKSYAIADNGSLDHNLTRFVLGSMGVSPDSPSFVPIGAPAARVQALAAGKIDATTVSYGTYLSIADTAGIHILVSPEDFSAKAPGLSKFVAALDSTITAKHEALQRFVDAIIDASRTYEANPEMWVDAIAAVRDDLKKENLMKTAKFSADRWCAFGCLNEAELDKAVKFVYENPDFAGVKAIAASDVVDTDFVKKSAETLGAYSGTSLDKP